jgi:hypothetical protein
MKYTVYLNSERVKKLNQTEGRYSLAIRVYSVYKQNRNLKLAYNRREEDSIGIVFDPEPTEREKLLLNLTLSDLLA